MKRITAILSLLTLLLLMIGTTGCFDLPENSDESSSEVNSDVSGTNKAKSSAPFTLAYSSNDTLNPYKAKTSVNFDLCSLLYEGLTRLDESLEPKPSLAASVNSTSPNLITAVLNKDAKFSDGTAVKPEDIEDSFSLAKASSNFTVLLSNVESAKSDDKGHVVFELKSPDPNASACLSFPVIKKGTASAPIGSGRFVFKGGDTPTLNTNAYNGINPKIKKIRLLDIPDGDAMLYALESGSISYFYSDLAGGNIPSTTKASVRVPLNSIVFVGLNSRRTDLSKPEVRQALSAAIDQTDVCASAFAGRARPAVTPFNPSWSPANKLKGHENVKNITDAVAQLELAGYNIKSAGNKSLSLELLIGTGNSFREASAELLKGQLSKVGIKINIVKLSYKKFIERLKSSDFDLYIGEVSIPANMSLQTFLNKGGNASYGIKSQGDTSVAYTKYLKGEITLQQFTDIFTADIPFIPLCWRDGMAAFNRALSGVTPTSFDSFYKLENWVYS